jgi:hypothetical protein
MQSKTTWRVILGLIAAGGLVALVACTQNWWRYRVWHLEHAHYRYDKLTGNIERWDEVSRIWYVY